MNRFEEFEKLIKTTYAMIETFSSKPVSLPNSPCHTLAPLSPSLPPPPPLPPGTGPKDEVLKGRQTRIEMENDVKKSKKGSKDGSKEKRKKGSADDLDPSSSSSSLSNSDGISSSDESVLEKKGKRKRELSDSDRERFSLRDLWIKLCR